MGWPDDRSRGEFLSSDFVFVPSNRSKWSPFFLGRIACPSLGISKVTCGIGSCTYILLWDIGNKTISHETLTKRCPAPKKLVCFLNDRTIENAHIDAHTPTFMNTYTQLYLTTSKRLTYSKKKNISVL